MAGLWLAGGSALGLWWLNRNGQADPCQGTTDPREFDPNSINRPGEPIRFSPLPGYPTNSPLNGPLGKNPLAPGGFGEGANPFNPKPEFFPLDPAPGLAPSFFDINREERWLELANEPNSRLPKEVIDHIIRTGGKGVQERFGLELAHPPKRSNAQGYDYSEAQPKTSADHRGIEHRYLRERKDGTEIGTPKSGTRGKGKLSLPPPGSLP